MNATLCYFGRLTSRTNRRNITQRFARITTLLALGFLQTNAVHAITYAEAPMLAKLVKNGSLPAVLERLPKHPRIITVGTGGYEIGHYGKRPLRLLMSRTKDVRLMVVYGYARLMVFDEKFSLGPDILAKIDVVDNKQFTLHLREGHRWSDGHPFTAEDFRYRWEDVANNADLSPFGLDAALLVDEKGPTFEVLDEQRVRYTWHKPNPYFLSALAGTSPLYIYAPSHFLRQYHAKYTKDLEALNATARERGQRKWAALHNRMDSPYKNRIPNIPTLQPWVNTTKGPAQRFEFVRNPYYHRVDEKGQQLPYIDRVAMQISDSKLIPAKTGAGESDLQARGLHLSDFTFLKQNEKRNNLKLRLWQTTKGSHIALFPNLNASDPVWRSLMRDVRFRRAFSLAIDRHEINQVMYQGFALEGNNTIHEKSPLHEPKYRSQWATFDLKKANALLDEIGLTKRNDDGIRLLSDGREAVIVVETAGEDTEEVDVLELVHDTLIKAGIKLYTKPIQREVFRNRIFAGETLMSVWGGLENGVPSAGTSPQELAPTTQQQLQWPKWGQHHQDHGETGEAPDLPKVQELLALFLRWTNAKDLAAQEKIWKRMLEIHADQVFTIGVVASVPQPVVTSASLRNVPKRGVYNWEPGAHFGLYRPDTFWFK